jgi:hypothetical protein
VRYVLLSDSAPDVLERAPLHNEAHVTRLREAAEAFVAGDPCVSEGVVSRWELRGWNELFA